MNRIKRYYRITTVYLLMACSTCGWSQINVLLVGNSQLGVYDTIRGKRRYDLSRMLEYISESAPAEYPRIKSEISPGKTLRIHWERGDVPGSTRAMIASGEWDYVVIQEIYRPIEDDFRKYARKFNRAIRNCGAKTILFATAHVQNPINPYFKPFPEAFITLNDLQLKLGKELGIPVAAAGYAWMKFLGPDPSGEEVLDLYCPDKAHPGYKGSYIYACLLYATITGCNPAGLTSTFQIDPGPMESFTIYKGVASRMQKAAWDQYMETKESY